MNRPSTPQFAPDGAAGAADTPSGEARPGEARNDLRQRDIVEDALSLMDAVGTLSALEYLKSHAVDGRIIARVLLEPGRRRGSRELSAADALPALAGA